MIKRLVQAACLLFNLLRPLIFFYCADSKSIFEYFIAAKTVCGIFIAGQDICRADILYEVRFFLFPQLVRQDAVFKTYLRSTVHSQKRRLIVRNLLGEWRSGVNAAGTTSYCSRNYKLQLSYSSRKLNCKLLNFFKFSVQ